MEFGAIDRSKLFRVTLFDALSESFEIEYHTVASRDLRKLIADSFDSVLYNNGATCAVYNYSESFFSKSKPATIVYTVYLNDGESFISIVAWNEN